MYAVRRCIELQCVEDRAYVYFLSAATIFFLESSFRSRSVGIRGTHAPRYQLRDPLTKLTPGETPNTPHPWSWIKNWRDGTV
jgi:hypothetical protein